MTVCLKTRFGPMEARSVELLRMEPPMPGFEQLKQYVLVRLPEYEPFHWLQSVEDETVAFPIVDPRPYFPDYQPELSELQCDPSPLLYCVVSQNQEQLGLNLLAPVLVWPGQGRAGQFVLPQSSLSTFHPLGPRS